MGWFPSRCWLACQLCRWPLPFREWSSCWRTVYLLLLLLLLLLWILLLAASLRESCNPCLGGSVSSVLIAFRGPCSAPMDPLQRRRRGATGWVLGAGCWAHGAWHRRISPSTTPHSAPASFKQAGPLCPRRHGRLAEADYTSAHMHKLAHTPAESDSMGEGVCVYRAPENTSFP